jgi:glycosyltransferase involved in cell wall biosynthesis
VTADTERTGGRGPHVVVVGSGWRFTSGISYYTCRLTNALAAVTPTSAVLVRRLVPRALYPGRRRVGQVVNDLAYAPSVRVLDGVDWYWGASMVQARAFLAAKAPDVLVLQWWTGATLHTYLALAAMARARGARVVMEWHEVQDTGEARIPGVVRYVRKAMRLLMRRVDAHVVHSQYDLDLLREAYGLDAGAVTVVPHGPYDHVAGEEPVPAERADDGVTELLYFGIIRPYKGVEDLVEAFSGLPREVLDRVRLRIVGETWEGWDAPLEAVRTSPARDRIEVVNRYVTDAEVQQYFAQADAVVLPYRRSSSSGPLHIAMSSGLPVVVTSVGGLVEAAGDYEGARFVPVGDVAALRSALAELPAERGRRYADPHSWDASVAAYASVISSLGVSGWPAARPAPVNDPAPA